jgi:signal transduction histidine kinase
MSSAEAATAWSGAERMPIGRQLHDIVVPQLFVLTTGLTALRRRQVKGTADIVADALVQDLVDTATQALSDLRAISRGRVTGAGGSLGLVGRRLREETKTVAHLTECHVFFDVRGDVEIGPDLADDLVAFVWEALANAIRHGGACRVDVAIRVENGCLVLSAVDDGHWREPTDGGGTGLGGLERRAARWGGAVSVDSTSTGTRLEWCVPLASVDVGPSPR